MKRVPPFILVLLLWTVPTFAQRQQDPYDQNIRTGPEVGERIPDFRALDQSGRMVDFDSIKGTNGAMVYVNRSADW